jgi:hypothetical protein
MDGNTNTNVQDIIDEHFIKSIDSILIAKHREINIMNSLDDDSNRSIQDPKTGHWWMWYSHLEKTY